MTTSDSPVTSAKSPIVRFPSACPCCGYSTLLERGEYEICLEVWHYRLVDREGKSVGKWFDGAKLTSDTLRLGIDLT